MEQGVVKRETRGYAEMVRYADDSVECFENREEVERYLRSVKKRLEKFGTVKRNLEQRYKK